MQTQVPPSANQRTQRLWLRRAVAFVALAFIATFVLSPPWSVLEKADAVGSAVCHRISFRSFHLAGRQLPLCVRCTGTYLGVIAGLGDSSRHTWMKLPYCDDFYRVTLATTMPVLMLGGPSRENPIQTYQDFATGMATRANVRGALVGRNITFPGREDPAAVAHAINAIVHDGISAEEAVELTMTRRDRRIDYLNDYIG